MKVGNSGMISEETGTRKDNEQAAGQPVWT